VVVVVVVVVVAVVVVVVKVITGGGERHQRTGVRVAASEAGGVDVVADHSFFLFSCRVQRPLENVETGRGRGETPKEGSQEVDQTMKVIIIELNGVFHEGGWLFVKKIIK